MVSHHTFSIDYVKVTIYNLAVMVVTLRICSIQQCILWAPQCDFFNSAGFEPQHLSNPTEWVVTFRLRNYECVILASDGCEANSLDLLFHFVYVLWRDGNKKHFGVESYYICYIGLHAKLQVTLEHFFLCCPPRYSIVMGNGESPNLLPMEM